MKIDGGLFGDFEGVKGRIETLEADGFDGAISAEMASDPFLPLLLAAEHSEKIELMTSIAVAFARNPMNVANLAHDLNAYSKGRFTVGLGSQIKPHITRRFSMPWSHPAPRMREFILAMRAIWACWYEGKPLEFQGEFYSHTLMTPMFSPKNTEYGAPRVFLAAVGPKMTEVAGEVGDGLIAHGFTTEKYLREVTLPAMERGLAKAGRDRRNFEVSCPVFVVTGDGDEEREASRRGACQQLAFYASTPTYRPVLELHGWEETGRELTRLSKQGEWVKMGTYISDEMLEAFAIVADPDDVAPRLVERFGGAIDRLACTFAFVSKEQREAAMQTLHDAD